jgi:hypothetical protein
MSKKKLFWNLGHSITKHDITKSEFVGERRFKSFFGVSPVVCSICWEQLIDKMPIGSKPIHLLWTLLFLKRYNSEEVNRTLTGVNEKTFRKWIWLMIELLAKLEVVK